MLFNLYSVLGFFDSVLVGLMICGYDFDDWVMLDDVICVYLVVIVDFDRVGVLFILYDCKDLDNLVVVVLKVWGVLVLIWIICSLDEEVEVCRVVDNIIFEDYLVKFV